MKVTAILVLAGLGLASVLEQRDCAGNNCNRQVTGTRVGLPDLASRSVDCSSFMAVVVTPPTRTITVTSFVPPGPTPAKRENAPRAVEARQVTVTPSAIPTYASSCDNRAEYSSACSCAGITERTTTVRAPRTTTTVTAVATDCVNLAVNGVPVCAHDCFATISPTFGCQGIEDLACQCANFEDLGWAVTPCVEKACTHREVEAIFPAAQKGCNCFAAANPVPTSV